MISNININELSFRKDINLVRALAVIGVLIYHFDKKLLSGGWLGVDLFFFISGYLISNKLILGLRSQDNYLRIFFKKRFLRLTPALISTSIFSSLFAYNFLSPAELKLHFDSAFYSLIYISNFFYTNLDFYNSPNNKYLTMLHTWSLGIEEQLYILLPVILVFVYKKNKQIVSTFTLLIIFSLVFNFFTLSDNLFYNPLGRFWEFLAGSIFMIFENFLRNNIKAKTSIFGIFLILFSFFVFEDTAINNIFPKFIALLGCSLFLLERLDNYFVNFKLIQTLGNISYSLYLFHQPIIAFMFIQNDKISELNFYSKLLIVFILFVLAYFNWKFIENSFKDFKFFKFMIGVYFLTVIFSGLIIFDIPDNFKILNIPNKIFLLKVKDSNILSLDGKSCNNRSVEESCTIVSKPDNDSIYILGDSSLRTLSSALLENPKISNYNLIHFTGNDCVFIFDKNPTKESCPNKSIEKKNEFGRNIKDSIIIYGARFPVYFSGTGFDNGIVKEDIEIFVIDGLKEEIVKTLKTFDDNNNQIILIYPIPTQGWNVPELFFYKDLPTNATVSYPNEVWFERQKEAVEFLDSLDLQNVKRIYPSDTFCKNIIEGACVGAVNGNIYYSDDDHLSLKGSRLISDEIMNFLSEN